MMGADFLIRHGQDYAHLDLRNSYGQFINAYYNTSYPSGADTLFGGSAFLLRLPLIWAFQPFNAFMLAIAAGPAWLLARQIGLDGALAALAALTDHPARARLRLRADRIGQGDHRAGDDPHARRARHPALALAAWPSARRRRRSRSPPPPASRRSESPSAHGCITAVIVLAVIVIGQIRASRQSARQPLLLTRSWCDLSRLHRRTRYMDRRVRVAEGGAEHRNDHQPGQPAETAPDRADARDVAGAAATSTSPPAACSRSPMRLPPSHSLAAVLGALYLRVHAALRARRLDRADARRRPSR